MAQHGPALPCPPLETQGPTALRAEGRAGRGRCGAGHVPSRRRRWFESALATAAERERAAAAAVATARPPLSPPSQRRAETGVELAARGSVPLATAALSRSPSSPPSTPPRSLPAGLTTPRPTAQGGRSAGSARGGLYPLHVTARPRRTPRRSHPHPPRSRPATRGETRGARRRGTEVLRRSGQTKERAPPWAAVSDVAGVRGARSPGATGPREAASREGKGRAGPSAGTDTWRRGGTAPCPRAGNGAGSDARPAGCGQGEARCPLSCYRAGAAASECRGAGLGPGLRGAGRRQRAWSDPGVVLRMGSARAASVPQLQPGSASPEGRPCGSGGAAAR